MKAEWRIFVTSIMFYTRIPCPAWVDHDPDMLNKATKYFPVIGWIVGSFGAFVYLIGYHTVSPTIGVILSMIATIQVTGAFHEDGFADVCDGFGGGWTKEKILKIMKDSSIGAYGTIGIMLMLLFKFLLLVEITKTSSPYLFVMILIAGHSLSRTNAVLMIFTDHYARENEDSKAKPVAKKMKTSSFIFAIVLGLSPLVFTEQVALAFIIPVLILVKMYYSFYFKKWIGGYTGDCLGALQQISEVIFYLSTLLIWKFI